MEFFFFTILRLNKTVCTFYNKEKYKLCKYMYMYLFFINNVECLPHIGY